MRVGLFLFAFTVFLFCRAEASVEPVTLCLSAENGGALASGNVLEGFILRPDGTGPALRFEKTAQENVYSWDDYSADHV